MAVVAGELRVGTAVSSRRVRRAGACPGHRPRYGLRRLVVVTALLAVAVPLAATISQATAVTPPVPSAPVAAVPLWARSPAGRAVVVGPGDTVWDLALASRPAGVDPVEWVARVVDDNRVEAAALRPGTVLRLPATSR